LSQTAASCPASRKARDSEARVLASSSTTSMCAFGAMIFQDSFADLCDFNLYAPRVLDVCLVHEQKS